MLHFQLQKKGELRQSLPNIYNHLYPGFKQQYLPILFFPYYFHRARILETKYRPGAVAHPPLSSLCCLNRQVRHKMQTQKCERFCEKVLHLLSFWSAIWNFRGQARRDRLEQSVLRTFSFSPFLLLGLHFQAS